MRTIETDRSIRIEKVCKTCETPFVATMDYNEPLGWPTSPSAFKKRRMNCPDCRIAEAQARQQRLDNERLKWTFETVKKYFADNPPQVGDPLILANLQFHQSEYQRVYVEKPEHTKQRRIIVDQPGTVGGLTFYRSGQSCFAPKGQTRLLPDHPVMAQLFDRFGSRIVLDDQALAAVMAGEEITAFSKPTTFGPITAVEPTHQSG